MRRPLRSALPALLAACLAPALGSRPAFAAEPPAGSTVTAPALAANELPPAARMLAPVLSGIRREPGPALRLPKPQAGPAVAADAAREAVAPAAPAVASVAAPVFGDKPLALQRFGPSKASPSSPPPLRLGDATLARVGALGRTVRAAGGTGVVIPEGALAGPAAITVGPALPAPAELERRELAASRRSLSLVGAPARFGPDGARFLKPVTLELAYDPSRLPEGVGEGGLAVHYWDPEKGEWEPLPSTLDAQARLVRARTGHFSTYQLLGRLGSATAASPGALLGEVYAYPNPASAGRPPKLHVASNAERLEIRIYDVAGELKHSADLSNPAAVVEHVWDVSGVGSGVYLYVVTAHRAGQAPARVSGKLGVLP